MTRDREERDLIMRDSEETVVADGLEASQHATTEGTETTNFAFNAEISR